MATYDAWNRAIIEHVTIGIPDGSMVYLSIDEEVIAQIGRESPFATSVSGDPFDDFSRAVRHRVVLEGKRVAIDSLARSTSDGRPGGVAFLALMVVAASHMADDEMEDTGKIDEKDYFRRLRLLLGLPPIVGRPEGMKAGSEEPLWRAWNAWLQSAAFVPTARRGEDQNKRFIAYPISQTLLRRADKERLRRIFRQQKWSAYWDGETILIKLRDLANERMSRFLSDAVSRPGPRYQALSDLLYEVYESWRETLETTGANAAAGSRTTNATLRCGLFREHDAIFGTTAYRLYPRMPAARKASGGTIRQGTTEHRLEVDRPGWFAPLDEVAGAELRSGARYPVSGIAGVTYAVLAERAFWVLVADLDEPENGFLASWRHPTLGEPALVLITREALGMLKKLEAESLVRWDGDPRPVSSLGDGWLEVRNCLVTSEALDGVFGPEQALFEELRPATKLGIGTRGGLRSPDRRGWIAGHGPEITVTGFESEVDVRVTRIATSDPDDVEILVNQSIACLRPFSIATSTPGLYRIDAAVAGHEATPRLVRLVSWDEMTVPETIDHSSVTVEGFDLLGATLRPTTGGA